MRAAILICDPIAEEGVNILKSEGFIVDIRTDLSREELRKIIANYDAVIVRSRTKLSREVIENAKKLKVIGRAGVGLDNIDLDAAKERGIHVFNTPDAPTESVAELTIGLILSVLRKIPEADKELKKGRWLKKELSGSILQGKTLGIIGYGRIGKRVARIAKSMGANIVVYDPSPDLKELEKVEGKLLGLEELLRVSDVITLHVPLTSSTYHMIGREQFKLMKNGAILINTARGAVVDEGSLVEALKSGKLAGAGIDVYEKEPPTDSELIRLPNVVCTPHIGAQTKEAQISAAVDIARRIVDFFRRNK